MTEIKRLLDLGADPNSILNPCPRYDNLRQIVSYWYNYQWCYRICSMEIKLGASTDSFATWI
ncbi:hypothetical protein [Leptospira weilii]|uniref:hypothetical protein n=1 Tax=Leptospira weilii TaxID=28184 RepID=UPI000AA2CE47|nr:hypothetical protein [Leptospira weilii]